MSDPVATLFLEDSRAQFRALKALADGALAQVDGEAFFAAPGPETNSIAVVVKHVAGNMLSRWSDFLASDGEKPWRDRDTEFELAGPDTREALLARWEEGWACLFGALDAVRPEDLLREVPIRGEPHTVLKAVHRQLAHYAGHAYQVVLLARHYAGPGWRTLSVPRGGTPAFNAAMSKRFPGGPE